MAVAVRPFLILAAVMLCAAAPPQEITFHGGALDGISTGYIVRPDNGTRVWGLKPSRPGASPVPQEDAAAVQAFVEAFQKHRRRALRGHLTEGAQQQICGHDSSDCAPGTKVAKLDIAEECTFNTPYYLGDHRVRLEWLFHGVLWYWSELNLQDGKISHVRTYPADVPTVVQLN